MSNFFLGPNFREKITMGSVEPLKCSSSTSEEQTIQNMEVEQEETKKEVKTKGKSDGKE